MSPKRGGFAGKPQTIAVVAKSPLLSRRLTNSLEKGGFSIRAFGGLDQFVKTRRQRPFVACFFDARGPRGLEKVDLARSARPSERYVLIRASWEDHDTVHPANCEFGHVCEGFTPKEILSWAKRASMEMQLLEGEQPLEELLLTRFRSFLRDIGHSPISDLHDLVAERVDRPLIAAVLEFTRGNQSKAADVLGIHRNTLRTKIKALGIDASNF